MELVQTVVTSFVVAVVGGVVALAMTGQFRSLHREIHARFDAVDRRFERVEASIDALRSDLTQVALAVGARPRAENG